MPIGKVLEGGNDTFTAELEALLAPAPAMARAADAPRQTEAESVEWLAQREREILLSCHLWPSWRCTRCAHRNMGAPATGQPCDNKQCTARFSARELAEERWRLARQLEQADAIASERSSEHKLLLVVVRLPADAEAARDGA